MRAVIAMPTGMAEPRDADAFPNIQARNVASEFINSPDDFMSGNDGKSGVGEFAVHDMQICAADAAGPDADADFVRSGFGVWQLHPFRRLVVLAELHGKHGVCFLKSQVSCLRTGNPEPYGPEGGRS